MVECVRGRCKAHCPQRKEKRSVKTTEINKNPKVAFVRQTTLKPPIRKIRCVFWSLSIVCYCLFIHHLSIYPPTHPSNMSLSNVYEPLDLSPSERGGDHELVYEMKDIPSHLTNV